MRDSLLAFLIALVVVAPAIGQSPRCGASERFGTELIRTGDSERRVLEKQPDRSVRLETREGGAAGFRHDFYRQGVTIQIYVRAGVVVEICRVRG